MIEEQLQSLIEAVNRLTDALNSRQTQTVMVASAPSVVAEEAPKPKAKAKPEPAPAPVAETPAPIPVPSAKLTANDLRALAQKLLDADKLPAILAINKTYGVKRITEAPVEKYPEIHAALTAALDAS